MIEMNGSCKLYFMTLYEFNLRQLTTLSAKSRAVCQLQCTSSRSYIIHYTRRTYPAAAAAAYSRVQATYCT